MCPSEKVRSGVSGFISLRAGLFPIKSASTASSRIAFNIVRQWSTTVKENPFFASVLRKTWQSNFSSSAKGFAPSAGRMCR